MRDGHASGKKRRGYSDRAVDTREPRERFLIVCEGTKTEPKYFKSFRVPGKVIEVRGMGANTVSLVRTAIELRNKDDYDQVWCVFDRDSFPPDHFNEALALAAREKIEVAYSNEAFELWYVLHFEFLQTGIPRNDYMKKLDGYLRRRYEKNDENIYDGLESLQPVAIQNARRLLAQYSPPNPVHDNPSTTVHLLVEQLNRFRR